jgi:23S rRNA (cytidine1920-2'-O)/16S rRNA (cytidine1409-2'-O)-methyltransferase
MGGASTRVRLDEAVVARGLADSRAVAQRLIMAGSVRVNGQLCDRASRKVAEDDIVEVAAAPRFVSRGGDKLDTAIEDLAEDISALGVAIAGAVAIDVGASTGGFTDCLLQRGAAHVIAVDVGYGQLHQRLREDDRVTVLERTNARHLEPNMLRGAAPDLLVCDASFIPLRTVLPAPIACMRPGFWGMVLCKPQFEAGRERINSAGKGGVIRDEVVRDQIVAETVDSLRSLGLSVHATVQAHPPGPKGNIEYVMLVRDAR